MLIRGNSNSQNRKETHTMTENQEKQVFKILNNLVASVNGIREDIVEIKADIVEIKADIVEIKADIVEIKADIVEIRADIVDIRNVQADHGIALKRLETKTDAIALEVADHGRRIDKLERESEGRVN